MLDVAPLQQPSEIVPGDLPLGVVVDCGAGNGQRQAVAERRPIRTEQEAATAPSAGEIFDAVAFSGLAKKCLTASTLVISVTYGSIELSKPTVCFIFESESVFVWALGLGKVAPTGGGER